MTTILVTDGPADLGRVATFTFPDIPFNDLLVIKDLFGLSSEPPLTSYGAALTFAVEDLCKGFRHGRVRWVPRALRQGTSEIVEEVLIAADGQVKGERRTIARFVMAEGKIKIDTREPALIGLIEEGVWTERIEYHRFMVAAKDVGQWASDTVRADLRGAPLANRGHSFHVLAPYAKRFDRWLASMVEAGGGYGECLVTVFATMDSSPENVASLVRSITGSLDEAIERATVEAAKATTPRGVENAVKRLRDAAGQLQAYEAILGSGLADAKAKVENAAVALLMAEM